MDTIKVLELIGTSATSWEDAAQNAIRDAQKTLQGITGLEVVAQTAKVEDGKIKEFRATVKIALRVKNS
jgi:hypothetical protein